jgi:hypothetical protein
LVASDESNNVELENNRERKQAKQRSVGTFCSKIARLLDGAAEEMSLEDVLRVAYERTFARDPQGLIFDNLLLELEAAIALLKERRDAEGVLWQ